ncbi:beta-microseminoprotein [Lingula anatina]|uniref:Beta-microseminoprotein n=1 Tax=Lingula anatina TaxID=7574 RepID=A0A1S3I4G1_LINAN|nr:beta-microseminoprotein [Lingula anatina]|eukprot:XP_013393152.1 beta-microseminoprotein [Lingula anatina]
MNVWLFSLLFACFYIRGFESFCYTSMPVWKMSDFGTGITYCKHKDLLLRPGSVLKTADCMRCTCTENGMSCCGEGLKAGTFGLPPKCKMVEDNCKAYAVLKENERMDCFTKKPVEFGN